MSGSVRIEAITLALTTACSSGCLLAIDEDRVAKPSQSPPPSSTGGVSDEGLVAYWSFDEGEGPTAADSSGNDNTLTREGATWSAGGKVNGALAFDGTTSHADAPSSSSINGITTALTVTAWVYMTDTIVGQYYGGIVTRRSGRDAADLWTLIYVVTTNEYRFVVSPPSGGNTAAVAWRPEDFHNWVHWSGVYDGSRVTLYRAGMSVASAPVSGQLSEEISSVVIGASDNGSGGFGEYFHGMIDEVRIYRRALSPEEVGALSGGT
jgi:hypothetical protein